MQKHPRGRPNVEKVERNRSILQRHYAGETMAKIAKDYPEITYATVVGQVQRQREDIHKAYSNGTPVQEICEKYGLPNFDIVSIFEDQERRILESQARRDAEDRELEHRNYQYELSMQNSVANDALDELQQFLMAFNPEGESYFREQVLEKIANIQQKLNEGLCEHTATKLA